jgi:hypothetical protein
MNFNFVYDCQRANGQPIYRYFKLAFTIALRLGCPIDLRNELRIDAAGSRTDAANYKGRSTFLGTLVINGQAHEDIIFVADESKSPPELVTFWRKGQRGDHAGTKGGAHPFAELYMGFLQGKITEGKVFDTKVVADLSTDYNLDPTFNIQAWIVEHVPADAKEPPRVMEPVEEPASQSGGVPEPVPELRLVNKWRSDVLRSGVPYTNYEVDACVRNVRWNSTTERIELEMHWEDGKYVAVRDFGKFDRYASVAARQRVLDYLKSHDGRASRPRMILTLKGEQTDWTLAAATMLKRLAHLKAFAQTRDAVR